MARPTLRHWQSEALVKLNELWASSASEKALIAVCPGAGKTLFSAIVLLDYIRDNLIDLGIVVAPTVNIQEQWVEEINNTIGPNTATADASNASLRWRQKAGIKETESFLILVITYQQLAQDAALFVAIATKCRIMLVGDEIHHADDTAAFGKALGDLAHQAKYRLALSGTPFNSKGGALAMCDYVDEIDAEGRHIRRTVPLYTYSFGEAISAIPPLPPVCRPIEFIKMIGTGQAIYKSLIDGNEFRRMIDLAQQNKTDSLGILLDANGEFMAGMIRTALEKLTDLQQHDRKAGMLVVAKDKAHGHAIAQRIQTIATEQSQWRRLTVQEIYNDTPKAHALIHDLRRDNTDVIISVRMISEGVDIKRLRVGLFATDYLTRMFFTQFTGRFCRWEDRLAQAEMPQFGWVIIPGHVTLLEYAREIEQMMFDAIVKPDGEGEGGEEREPKNVFVGSESEVTDSGVIYRSREDDGRDLAKLVFDKIPDLRGQLTESLAIVIGRAFNVEGAESVGGTDTGARTIDWRGRNNTVCRRLVNQLVNNGESDRATVFAHVNQRANQAVGIQKMDGLTPEPILIRRHQFLVAWLNKVIFGGEQGTMNFGTDSHA
jgi:superfamily II DNA or RNA helicase